ncbi:SPOR domain-containing protein [Streptomyces pathocidini]|uniref:SPOR domain-containing protein n=1 Tax=Streptomyces pathocidini TaxID=1650571 RepID=A0ABW7UN33_9ACTN|nr:SPOR domain-containing protein [Streptomyces pathocidini]
MTDIGPVLPWLVIREEENGNRYRVGRYATRAEAERTAERLRAQGGGSEPELYLVERIGRRLSS